MHDAKASAASSVKPARLGGQLQQDKLYDPRSISSVPREALIGSLRVSKCKGLVLPASVAEVP